MSRRLLLTAGAALGAGLLTGCQRAPEQAGPGANALAAPPSSAESQPVMTARNLSTGRYREVDVVIIRPEGAPPEPIPVCVALHGGLAGAKVFLEYGLPRMLTDLVKAGTQPFAVAAVDGGNWVGNKDDDPQRMLDDDLPGWLSYHDLASTPFAVLGFGEGGSAALNQAKSPGFQAIAAIAPTLFSSWDSASRARIFTDQAQWERTEPMRHTVELTNAPLGLWCGTEDNAYIELARQLAQRANAVKSSFTAGGHDDAYFKRVLPDALKFVAGYL
ncbi:hypothetical protein [Actinokineospora inagensis]|uniref:hypothetical protein n=1 Tax=Actinokineospora inagensis TaxID=103730 RepID=UPI0003F7DFAF|nr:hypothetical protein [Actinokineospora inagensis]